MCSSDEEEVNNNSHRKRRRTDQHLVHTPQLSVLPVQLETKSKLFSGEVAGGCGGQTGAEPCIVSRSSSETRVLDSSLMLYANNDQVIH